MNVSPLTSLLRRIAIVVVLCAMAWASFSLRRRFIATWFRDGRPQPALTLPQPGAGGAAAPAAQTRVLLIDGLDRATAAGLPAFSRLCARGQELVVDVGFPTVSLPVQAVLWTGRTQQQSGLLYRLKALPQPPADSLPARVPGSVAVAEDQAFIAGSFGFAEVVAPPAAEVATRALSAVAGAAPLVFVHALRVDKAGHKGDAAAYAEAARTADQLLGTLLEAAPPGPDRRWFVLSDHGHRAGGGHGGASEDVRLVRACVAGGTGAPMPTTSAPVHLVDLSRALSDSLGLEPRGVGRPLAFAHAQPAPGATLPPTPWRRFVVAGLAAAVVLVVTGRKLGRRAPLLWAWVPVAYGGLLLAHGALDLSNPAIYPPFGRDLLIAAGPGLVLLAVVAARRVHGFGEALAALAPALAGAVATLVACGGFAALLDPAFGPPLERHASAAASAWLVLTGGGALALALARLVTLGRAGLIAVVRARRAQRRT
jgi:hypothetical protein